MGTSSTGPRETITARSIRFWSSRIRPPHIHFRVSRRGYHELVTQMYFAGEVLNEKDLIRKELAPKDQERVTVGFEAAA